MLYTGEELLANYDWSQNESFENPRTLMPLHIPADQSIAIDIGSGAAPLVFAAAVNTQVTWVGIELSEELHRQALTALVEVLKNDELGPLELFKRISFIQGDAALITSLEIFTHVYSLSKAMPAWVIAALAQAANSSSTLQVAYPFLLLSSSFPPFLLSFFRFPNTF